MLKEINLYEDVYKTATRPRRIQQAYRGEVTAENTNVMSYLLTNSVLCNLLFVNVLLY